METVCQLAAPTALDPYQEGIESLPKIQVKLTLPQVTRSMFFADLQRLLYNAIMQILSPFVIEDDIDIVSMEEFEPSAYQKSKGRLNTTVLELDIFLSDVRNPRATFRYHADAFTMQCPELTCFLSLPGGSPKQSSWEHSTSGFVFTSTRRNCLLSRSGFLSFEAPAVSCQVLTKVDHVSRHGRIFTCTCNPRPKQNTEKRKGVTERMRSCGSSTRTKCWRRRKQQPIETEGYAPPFPT